MSFLPALPRQASRVVRTIHQVLAAVLLSFPALVAVVDLPAEKVATASAVLVFVVGVVARAYNLLWPAEPPLDPNA